MIRTLRNGGVLYMAIPDKRYTFDASSGFYSIATFVEITDHGENSKRQAYEEWVRALQKTNHTTDIEAETARLMDIDYSIHYHCWTQSELLELISVLKKDSSFEFELELFAKIGIEVVVVLRKSVRTR
jgi:hypothetical protein